MDSFLASAEVGMEATMSELDWYTELNDEARPVASTTWPTAYGPRHSHAPEAAAAEAAAPALAVTAVIYDDNGNERYQVETAVERNMLPWRQQCDQPPRHREAVPQHQSLPSAQIPGATTKHPSLVHQPVPKPSAAVPNHQPVPEPPSPATRQTHLSSRAERNRPRGGKKKEWHGVYSFSRNAGMSDAQAATAANRAFPDQARPYV